MKNLVLSVIFLMVFVACQFKEHQDKDGKDLQIEKNVEKLLHQMTLDEKIAEMTQDAPANDRLGIPFMKFGEGLHGLWYDGVTVYPQAIAFGSTWDPELIRKMASQTAIEARALNTTHCYSPNLDVVSGDAIADAIFGDVNPGGKLTVSFPRSVGQIPVTYLERPDFIGSGKGQYGFTDKSPLFPFGYGLSYTSFEYGKAELASQTIKAGESTTVSVKVSNTGKRDGDEVVQMYVRDDFASVGRYNKMLKGFRRITEGSRKQNG